MNKILLIISIIVLIVAITVTKNSTKKIDKKIYTTKENIRFLKNKYEYVLLDYNYLSSPKKLMEYQAQYFENELGKIDIEKVNQIILRDNSITFKDSKNKLNE